MKNKRTPEQIFAELERMANILPAPFYWLDTKGIILGANDLSFKKFGGDNNREKVIGQEHYNFYPKDIADAIVENNNKVIELGDIVEFEEKIANVTTGVIQYFTSVRSPLRDDEGNIIGVIGTSVEITAEKEAQQQKEEAQRQKDEAQQKFKKTVDQMIHDMGTPLAALDILIANCGEISEETRINIREALSRINGITGNVLNQYRAEKTGISYSNQYETKEPIMLYPVLLQLISERRQQHPKLKFSHDFPQASTFTFINAPPLEFQRMISNLINNAVDAVDSNMGRITLRLEVTDKLVNIFIEDNGKGMPTEVADKILNNIEITQGKTNGHGIGMGQVRDTLANNNGQLAIASQIGNGTQITLTFPKITVPNWIAEKIELYDDDLVIILDDDSSIHGAWDQRFKAEVPHIRLKHFTLGTDTIKFINRLDDNSKQKIFLLTDFELLKQDLNGLDVIEQTTLQRSILVTSHYANKEVQQLAGKTCTRILAKQRVAAEVPIFTKSRSATDNNSQLKIVDLVILDDDKFFGELLVSQLSATKIVDYYSDANQLLDNINQYPKTTVFSLDNQLGNISGLNVAQKLYHLGFTNLYMLSGEIFMPDQIPDYLTVIMKTDPNAFNLLNSF